MDLEKICIGLQNNNKTKDAIYELLKPYLNILADKLMFYLIVFILFVLISFLLNLGVLIILLKYLKNK